MSGGQLPLLSGIFEGRLPLVGKREWTLYYIELTNRHVHIFEGNVDPSRNRKHLQSLELHSSDTVGNDGRDKKNEYKFYYDRGSGGKYFFKCRKEQERENWVMSIWKLIQKQEYLEKGLLDDTFTTSCPPSLKPVDAPVPPPHRTSTLPSNNRVSLLDTPPTPPPHKTPPSPFQKRDSGFVSGTGVVLQSGGFSGEGDIVHDRCGSGDTTTKHNWHHSKSSSADGTIAHKTHKPKSVKVDDNEDLTQYDWYWGQMSRDECGKELMERGKIGNFVVRKNDRGDYVMSFWRKDGIHHHRILKNGDRYRFEKSVVQAEGIGIPDLLDTYMKHCTDKTIGPFGGELHLIYSDAWNPPDIDFKKFEGLMSSGNFKFRPGTEMSNNTYGGHSLDDIKLITENVDHKKILLPPNNKKKPPAATLKPEKPKVEKPAPPSPKKKPVKAGPPTTGKLNLSIQQQLEQKFSQQQGRAPQSSGYVNLHPPSSPQVKTSPRQSYISDEDDDDDDEQEVYIAPGDIDGSDSPIYQNHSVTDESVYANYPLPPINEGVYQNVTFDGKPITPPRSVKPAVPQVKPRRK